MGKFKRVRKGIALFTILTIVGFNVSFDFTNSQNKPWIQWGQEVFAESDPGMERSNIVAGYYHTLALQNDGTVMSWG